MTDMEISEVPIENSDSRKLIFELFRHAATVSSAAILVTMGVVEKFVHNPNHRWLMAATFGLFGLCILTSMPAMMILAVMRPKHVQDNERRNFTWVGVTALAGMFGGFICLAEFLWYNF